MELKNVYGPKEDTYLLMDALEKSKSLFSNCVVLEIGCGSGEVVAFLKTISKNLFIVGSDVNLDALLVSKGRVGTCELVLSDLLGAIRQECVDIAIFNPPYVETEECKEHGIKASYSGGKRGRVIIDRLVSCIKIKVFFLLLTRKNAPQEVLERLVKCGYSVEVVEKRRTLGESLVVIKGLMVKQ